MNIAHIIIFFVVLLLLTLLADPIARKLKLPFSLILVVLGFVVAKFVVEGLAVDTGIRAGNFHDLVFYLFLPILIFESAYHMDTKLLRQNLLPILILSLLGMVITTILVGIGLYYGIGHPSGFPWIAALIAGALLAATDPVAVLTQFKSSGAPKRLAILMEGESLFNDATAVVLFTLLIALATNMPEGQDINVLTGFLEFNTVFFGGLFIGGLIGVCGLLLFKLYVNPLYRTMISIVITYTAFFLAEQGWQVSGVMAVLMAGLILGWARERYADDDSDVQLDFIWRFISYVVTAAVFLLVGLTIELSMFEERWLAILIAIGVCFIARLLMVVFSLTALEPFPSQRVPLKYQMVITWGGLRGAVTVVLALSLPLDLPYWYTIQSIAFGVVIFTLLIQAPTMSLLLRALKLHQTSR